VPLTQVSLNASLTWQLARAVAGFTDVLHGPETAAFTLATLDTAVWNELFAAQYVVAGSGGTQTVDLRTFNDLPGNAVTADKALVFVVLVAGAATDRLNVKPHGTNGLQWFFGGTTEGVNVPGGGLLLFADAEPGVTVDATHKQLLLTNNGGGSLTVKLLALVSDT
jgi:hypothetical protein